jgi:hypothetical protein
MDKAAEPELVAQTIYRIFPASDQSAIRLFTGIIMFAEGLEISAFCKTNQ